jgi:hypothetical protein
MKYIVKYEDVKSSNTISPNIKNVDSLFYQSKR